MDSPEGEHYREVSDTLAELLEYVQLDAQQRQFIWPDSKRRSLEQSVRHIRKQYPRLPAQTIADALISWVEQGYVPKVIFPRFGGLPTVSIRGVHHGQVQDLEEIYA